QDQLLVADDGHRRARVRIEDESVIGGLTIEGHAGDRRGLGGDAAVGGLAVRLQLRIVDDRRVDEDVGGVEVVLGVVRSVAEAVIDAQRERGSDRKSTRLNSSHVAISYAVFCLKKKN